MPRKSAHPKPIDPRDASGALVGRAVNERTGEVVSTVTISAEQAAQMAARADALRPLLRKRFEIEQKLADGMAQLPTGVRSTAERVFSDTLDVAIRTILDAKETQDWLTALAGHPAPPPRGRKTPTPRAKAA